ncbi:hypothetical protein NQ315_015481 [Exocentrus adspersus]|uniref:DUF7041 domain-containing protein n=1 Tax=Exocentrus adspersus TaxID=1586481 RepID=A0AAV8VP17_9CUCU|nr:hypothetical protein NQ315_015481 [Exocentrus adspersus]
MWGTLELLYATIPDTGPEDANTPQQPSLHRVAVRVPPFWPEDREIWFAQIENQFVVAGVVIEDTKCSYVAGNIEARYAKEVRDIPMRPPQLGKYQTLKSELIKRLSSSQEEKTCRLLAHEVMGDSKSSQFLRHLQGLEECVVPDSFIRFLYLGRLPAIMQAILATQAKADLATVAELADTVEETTTKPYVAETMGPHNMLECKIMELTTRMQLKAGLKCHSEDHWLDVLPAVLLGIRTSWCEDLAATTAELVYQETLRLHGEFLISKRAPN